MNEKNAHTPIPPLPPRRTYTVLELRVIISYLFLTPIEVPNGSANKQDSDCLSLPPPYASEADFLGRLLPLPEGVAGCSPGFKMPMNGRFLYFSR